MATAPTVPNINVCCSWPQCSQHLIEITVPAGVLLAPNVMLAGTMSCLVCGMQMNVLGKAS